MGLDRPTKRDSKSIWRNSCADVAGRQSVDYGIAARAAGDTVNVVEVPDAGHFQLIDIQHPAYNEVLTQIEGWPTIDVEVDGQRYARPAVLEVT